MIDLAARMFRRAPGGLKGLRLVAERVNGMERAFSALPDSGLRGMTDRLRQRAAAGEGLDALMPEAFATVREAARRVLGQRHYDVQVMGGAALHQGRVAEMRTGEGKTLVATLPSYLNALTGRGVHVVTANDYLARRDAEAMGSLHRFLGLSVGCVLHGMPDEARREAYACDVTYGTNSEFGFDYLRDNMKPSVRSMVQRPFHYAIVDEVDSILIDEARTPLIISGQEEDDPSLYVLLAGIVPDLAPEDYVTEERWHVVALNDSGIDKLEAWLRAADAMPHGGLYDPQNAVVVHHVSQALRAQFLYRRDKDYIVRDGKVLIVDEFTGRAMEGRRFSDGLHQALEAKEGVAIQHQTRTLASVTYQNFFRLYPKLAGMTGTAASDADELAATYGLDVVRIPTNRPVVRRDHDDVVFLTEAEKFAAVVAQVEDCYRRRQPVLVGTASVERSERLSAMLGRRGIPHRVLNAHHHEREAHVVSQAGRPGAVTIATNMAGRGTDILLGGNVGFRIQDEVEPGLDGAEREALEAIIHMEAEGERREALAAGGLFVIGTERHESRRIDEQLRGRSGRQGEPGESRFYLSLGDDLVTMFLDRSSADRLSALAARLDSAPGAPIRNRWLTRAIARAQRKVEDQHRETRKNLLRFDDVVDAQRRAIYAHRRDIIEAGEVGEVVEAMRSDVLEALIAEHLAGDVPADDRWADDLADACSRLLGVSPPLAAWAEEDGGAGRIAARLRAAAEEAARARDALFPPDVLPEIQRGALVGVIDRLWHDQIEALDHLRLGIGLRAYGQRNPLVEYKIEALDLFRRLLDRVREETVESLSHAVPAGGGAGGAEGQSKGIDLRLHHNLAITISVEQAQAGGAG